MFLLLCNLFLLVLLHSCSCLKFNLSIVCLLVILCFLSSSSSSSILYFYLYFVCSCLMLSLLHLSSRNFSHFARNSVPNGNQFVNRPEMGEIGAGRLEVILNRNDSKVERFKTIENVHWLGFISFIAKVKYTMQTKMDAVLLFKLYEIVNKVTFSIDSHYLVDLFDFGHSKNSKQFNLSEEWATWNFNMSILILISISISECLSFFRLWESTHWFYLSNSPTLYLLEKKELSFITYSH